MMRTWATECHSFDKIDLSRNEPIGKYTGTLAQPILQETASATAEVSHNQRFVTYKPRAKLLSQVRVSYNSLNT